jgi:hypothetical protein
MPNERDQPGGKTKNHDVMRTIVPEQSKRVMQIFGAKPLKLPNGRISVQKLAEVRDCHRFGRGRVLDYRRHSHIPKANNHARLTSKKNMQE